MTTRAPILILGAHRSGTSALSRVLDTLGVFVGKRLDPNHEASFFLELNDWLLRQCGGRWDHPLVFDDLLDDANARELVRDHLAFVMRSPRAVGFLGIARYLRYRRIDRIREPWGFKDPRTTFTLPLWLELFPDAKVLHIHRHGVDVANSLVRRHAAHLDRSRRGVARNRAVLAILAKRAGFGESYRCGALAGAFAVWEEYVTRARTHVEQLGERALELRYEDLARDPAATIAAICAFGELQPTASQLERAAALVSAERAGAHRSDPTLRAFADTVEERVRALTTRVPATAPTPGAVAKQSTQSIG